MITKSEKLNVPYPCLKRTAKEFLSPLTHRSVMSIVMPIPTEFMMNSDWVYYLNTPKTLLISKDYCILL